MTENPEKSSETRPPPAPARRPGTWQKGQSGNPAGKPIGARKRITRAIEGQIAEAAPELVASVIEAGRTDWRPALELLKMIGLKARTLIEAPDLPPLQDAADIVAAQAHVIKQVTSGEMSADEGAALAALLEAQRKALETETLEARLAALEQRAYEQ
jgi:hypothetical protein